MKVIQETGLTTADEMLYPENYKYVDDLLSYVAVGARSVEDQQHRLTASAADAPVGMKNPTSGDYSVMMNSIHAAQSGHTFIYRGWEGTSAGNPYAHAILRGYTNSKGEHRPNYHYEEQPRILREVMNNRRYNERIRRIVKGFLVESYIEDGNQKVGGGCYGKSITDPCLGWEKSERLILEMAEMV